MQVINRGSRYGLRKLAEGAGLSPGEISSENISYVIVPHLNEMCIRDSSSAGLCQYGDLPAVGLSPWDDPEGNQAWEERLHDLCVYSADVDEFFAPHNGMAGPA